MSRAQRQSLLRNLQQSPIDQSNMHQASMCISEDCASLMNPVETTQNQDEKEWKRFHCMLQLISRFVAAFVSLAQQFSSFDDKR